MLCLLFQTKTEESCASIPHRSYRASSSSRSIRRLTRIHPRSMRHRAVRQQRRPNAVRCGQTQSAAATDEFPVVIDHALGKTPVKQTPQRVATVGWANHEVPLALGIVPVGMSKATWGDDDGNGIMPWDEEKLSELGGETPILFDETDGIPVEEVANTKPDVILASYSGLTKEDYETLSKIARVVAYPDIPWGTSMKDMTEMNATALGRKADGEKLVQDAEKKVADALDKHPDLKGKKVLFTSFSGTEDSSKVGFFSTKDPRMGFLAEHGFAAPDYVKSESEKSDAFWLEVSAEKPEVFKDADLVVSYSSGSKEDDEKQLKSMQSDPLLSKIPAIADGRVAFLENGPLGAAANPSPLSIPWGIDRYFEQLDEALKA